MTANQNDNSDTGLQKTPLKLRVQLLNKNQVVYQKTIRVNRKKSIFLNSKVNSQSIYFPSLGREADSVPFLRVDQENLQLHILPDWEGFYSALGKISILNRQEEWISVPSQSFGSFHEGDLTLSWQLHHPVAREVSRKPAAFRSYFHQSTEYQSLIVTSVFMLILCTGICIFAFRTPKVPGYMASLSPSQQLLLLDQGHIYAAPEYIDQLSSDNIFNDIVKYFTKYNLLLSNGEEDIASHPARSNFSELAAIHKEMIDDVIDTNNVQAQTNLIVPTIVGESQTTMLWRFLEKISFIQTSAKSFLESRKKLNAELLNQTPYEYDSPDIVETQEGRTSDSLSTIYSDTQRFAARSLRTSTDDDFFSASLRRQAASHSLPYMRSDFNLVHFGAPRPKDKLSKASPEVSNDEAPQAH